MPSAIQHREAAGLDWCASCHVVSADQERASTDAPPFATIAQSANFEPKRLAYFLLEPHPKMPPMALSRSAADDIAAYIQSLRK
jgi:mono/diheme cytochrome c family protein